MSTKDLNNDDNLNSLIKKAISNQDIPKLTNLLKSAIRRQITVDLTSELTQAVIQGNKALVELIYPYFRETPKLIPKMALSKIDPKSMSCFALLLENGFTIKPRDPDMRIFMQMLISGGYDNVFIRLMHHGVNVNVVDNRTGYSFLHAACLANRMRVVKFLIQQKANVNAKVKESDGTFPTTAKYMGKTALYIAIELCNIPLIKFLLKNGANPNECWEMLVVPIQKRQKEVVELLLENGAKLNLTDTYGNTVLHHCVENVKNQANDAVGNEIARILLDKGADVNAKTNSGSTPLYAATMHQNIKAMKILLNYNANIFTTKDGNNLVHIAISYDNYEILEMIQKLVLPDDYKKMVNARNNQGETPLHVGAKNAKIKCVQNVLSNSSDINLRDIDGKTPFHIAIEVENEAVIHALLTENPNVNIIDSCGQTPLHYAAKLNKNGLTLIQYLVNNGAHLNLMDYSMRVPLHFACKLKNTDIVDYLLKNGALINVQDKFKQSPLHWICTTKSKPEEDVNLFRLLKKYRVEINYKDSEGNTPLHYAVINGLVTITELLLKAGANIGLANKADKIAADYVSKEMQYVFNKKNKREKISESLRQYIIKLKMAGLKVDDRNINLAYKVNNNDAKAMITDYENSCKEELSRMKEEKYDGSLSNTLDTMFPIYADILKVHFEEIRIQRQPDRLIPGQDCYIDIIKPRLQR